METKWGGKEIEKIKTAERIIVGLINLALGTSLRLEE